MGIILCVGFPGSGKGTQGKRLAATLNIPHVSTGDLFRAEVARGSAMGKEMDTYMKAGDIIPPALTFAYLEQEFAKPAYARGFILDGYPKNRECLEWLLRTMPKWKLELNCAVELHVPRAEAERRLSNRLHCNKCNVDCSSSSSSSAAADVQCTVCATVMVPRTDDVPEAIRARLNVYEASTAELLEEYRQRGILTTVDGSRSIDEVTRAMLDAIRPPAVRSYYVQPVVASEAERSSRFHSHLDARDHALLLRMAKVIQERVPDAQSKIYPVTHLLLGPQVKDVAFADVYQTLPNFHTISDARDEAFLTGKMGEEDWNYAQIEATLNVAFAHPGCGVMTELEEELFDLTVDVAGNITEHRPPTRKVDGVPSSCAIDWTRLSSGWWEKQIANVPAFELHHGFDLPRGADEHTPTIALETLMQHTNIAGLQVGGWFVFAKPGMWCYRCNEFANGADAEPFVVKLRDQSNHLRQIVSTLLVSATKKKNSTRPPFHSTASLERVHAIWSIQ